MAPPTQIPNVVLQALTSFDAFEAVEPLPIGALIDAYPITTPLDGLASPYIIANRFPVPPSGVGFLTDDWMMDEPAIFDKVTGNPIISALAPAGLYLEPTIGQIWPRIG